MIISKINSSNPLKGPKAAILSFNLENSSGSLQLTLTKTFREPLSTTAGYGKIANLFLQCRKL